MELAMIGPGRMGLNMSRLIAGGHRVVGYDLSAEAVAQVSAGQSLPAAERCTVERPREPCAVVILGASGDLTARKLMPALFDLFVNDGLPEPFLVVGAARSAMDDRAFAERMRQALRQARPEGAGRLEDFTARLHYRRLDYRDPAGYRRLAEDLAALEREAGLDGNRIFYLALPPELYNDAAANLGISGLGGRRHTPGWSRLVVEKPFGRDLASAQALNRNLQAHFDEHSIFRIDHYLAKETVQSLLMFRFANSIFEPVWDRRYIAAVGIDALETLGVEHRAGYYEQAGVLRDMFQNHLMQLLALTAMEPPARFEAETVRDEKVKVFRALRPLPAERIEEHLVLGQYAGGRIDGVPVPGYRAEPGVAAGSLTPTYARMRVFLDNWRWQGVPFVLTSGKRLKEKRTEIVIQFRPVPHAMFRRTLTGGITANRLVLGIYPEEKITLTFQTKHPGPAVCLRTVTMDFHYHQGDTGPVLDAYEKVLLDVMLGDQTLFWRQDGLEKSWAFLSPVLSACEGCADRSRRLHFYPAGGPGPAAAGPLGLPAP